MCFVAEDVLCKAFGSCLLFFTGAAVVSYVAITSLA